MRKHKLPNDPKARLLAVAKDVLAQMALRRFTATSGIFFEAQIDNNEAGVNPVDNTKDLQELVPFLNSQNCKVCAIGACLLSFANVYDNIPTDDHFGYYGSVEYDGEDIFDMLDNFLDPKDLQLIETAFERGLGYTACDDTAEAKAAARLGARYINNERRMRAIMENIVRNSGKFDPFDKRNGLPQVFKKVKLKAG